MHDAPPEKRKVVYSYEIGNYTVARLGFMNWKAEYYSAVFPIDVHNEPLVTIHMVSGFRTKQSAERFAKQSARDARQNYIEACANEFVRVSALIQEELQDADTDQPPA